MNAIQISTPIRITAVSEEDLYGLSYRVEFKDAPPLLVGGKAVHQTMYGLVHVLDDSEQVCFDKILVASLIRRQIDWGNRKGDAVSVLSEAEADELFKKFGVPEQEFPD